MKDIFNKHQCFSIRKFSVGVASVLIGIALFTPSQGVLASTENSPSSVDKREEVQPILDNQNNPSSELDTRDVPIGSTRTTEPVRSGNKENNSLTTRDFVAGEDRSSTPAVRAASNPSEVKKYELTDEYAKQIKAGVIGSEGNKLDSLLLNGSKLSPEAYTDDDYLKDKEELYIYEKGGKKYVGYNSHPLLEDTDGDGIIDSKEKPDEKLKWNVSERDMIMFMELSYRDDNYIDRVLDHKRPLTESELYKKNGDSKPRYEYMMMNKELGPYWERKKSYHTSSGLDAVLYETKSDFLYLPNGTAQVLAFRGTSDAKDIGADITLGLGSNPQQGIDAENIMHELAKDKSITNLYLTGHSLGGYLVQRAMVEAYQLAYSDSRVMSPKEQLAYRNVYNNVLKKGTTFNAPKVVTNLLSSREFWQKGLDSKKIAKSGKMTHYIVDNDLAIRKGVSNDSDVVINVGRTSGGHSSRSYFEADMINRRSEFISGKRISLDGTGYQDKNIATVKSVEKVGETVVYSKRGDDIIKSITVSMKDLDTGQITNNTIDEVFKKDGAKSTVVVTQLEPSVRYEKDATRAKGEANVTTAGTSGTSTVTTTYSVDPNTGDLIEHVGQPVVKQPAIETVVKVAAKDEVEYIKKGDDVVKKTTSYTVNSKTGSLTSTKKEEVVNKGGAKDIVEYNSVEPKTVYLKDENSPKGTDTVQFLGKSGKSKVITTYSVNPVNGALTPTKGGSEVVTLPIARVVKVGAKDRVDVETIPSPVKYEKDASREKGQANITVPGKDGSKTTTTTYTVNPDNGEVTPNEGNPVIVNPTETIVKVAAKDQVVETPIEPTVVYERDDTRDFGTPDKPRKGAKGKSVTTTRYDVNPNNGTVTEQVGKPVVTPAGKTIVKVGAKTKVESSKDDQGREVINTTTYEVDPKTGKVTSTTVTTYGTRKELTIEKMVVPSPVVYEKDDTKEKGTVPTTVKGEDGEDAITTTYTVDTNTGKITASEGKPVRTKEPTNTVVKVAAKDKVEKTEISSPKKYVKDDTRDKNQPNVEEAGQAGSSTITTTYSVDSTTGAITETVGKPVVVNPTATIVKVAAKDKIVETPIEPEVEYVRDGEREVDTPNERIEGAKGKTVTTTTYDVDSKDGHITEHVGTPVVTPAGKTIVKVGAKTKVEQSKDSEGRDVIETTTYEVNPKTGKITPTTVLTYGKTKEPTNTVVKVAAKDKVVETPIEPELEYVRDGEREVDTPNERVEGAKGKTVTTTTYDVDSTDGHITEHIANNITTSAKVTPGKVTPATPVTPATNGNSGQDTPAPASTTPIPDAVTPNANHEDTTDASDNGTKSNDSQNVLPNTGTESNATLASLELLGLLGGLGLALRKKKED
ncbi:G5 domain-containing protein [Streptococcus pseudopneumoniae]|uniref:G5 domain-containing protein n=1 Tax=Streptococcus pseudopneumoniae TaxID=257758 RepID=UPI0018B02B39|nr:G5 domain-containing protein [Streptococcus pseudopneumoniae]MBF9619344.1 G5 domain-containing protein [Streptococcus pseudopneumoniae]